MKASRPIKFYLLISALLISTGVLLITGRYTYLSELQQLREKGNYQLNLYAAHLKGALAKYESLPELLANNQRLIEMLKNPASREREQALNHYLETINRITDAADTYLMNADGLTIAASNWNAEKPFIGLNFSYRPYFKQAMQGKLGRYYALGTTSLKRGYYFAFPVHYQQQILGAVVVKVDLTALEDNWLGRNEKVLVTDPSGFIFITTETDWRYRPLLAVSTETLQMIRQSRRYPNSVETGKPVIRPDKEIGEIRLVKDTGQQRRYLQLQRDMPEAGWQVNLLMPLKDIYQPVITNVLIALFTLSMLLLLWLYLQQRQKRQEEQILCETRARETLAQAHDELEIRIQERTSALRQTQDELIHAAKLAAIGQLSTGITHELNQPLTAIRSYADNAILLLQQNRTGDVEDNLQEITRLTERMAQISSQLKLFARKTDGQLSAVSISNAIDTSLKLMQPQIQKNRINIHQIIDSEYTEVIANAVQLEQILVNLIGNAVNAMEAQTLQEINISTDRQSDHLRLSVHDRGPGIRAENMDKVFDPFFTTRKTGLGLGLAISRQIAENMGGSLTAENHPDGGAEFILQLPLAHSAL